MAGWKSIEDHGTSKGMAVSGKPKLILKGFKKKIVERRAGLKPQISRIAKTAVGPAQAASDIIIKVKEILADFKEVKAIPCRNKVVIQGLIHEQLFFVTGDNIVRHLSEDIPFSTFIDIPGTEEGSIVHITPRIEKIITKIVDNGRAILKKFVIELFVKVTDEIQTTPVLGDDIRILADTVVGENTTQILIENQALLDADALNIEDIRASIADVVADAVEGKAVVQGIIHKQVFYKASDGLLRHTAEDIPFSAMVELPGLQPGDEMMTRIDIEKIIPTLEEPRLLRQDIVLGIFVKATRPLDITIERGSDKLILLQEILGEAEKQILIENELDLGEEAEKIRDIRAEVRDLKTNVITDKAIIQGILHKQIFFIGADSIERHRSEDIPFSLFVDLPGAGSHDRVRVIPIIEKILFTLREGRIVEQKAILKINATAVKCVQDMISVGDGLLVLMEEVVGEGTKQLLVEKREERPVEEKRVEKVTIVKPGPSVVGMAQEIITNRFDLPERAIKIITITAEITDVELTVVDSNIIASGNIIKTITFVTSDNIVRSITETVPFTITIPLPPLPPEVEVEVNLTIETIIARLIDDGRRIEQLIVLKGEAIAVGAVEEIVVVTAVIGPGITTETVLVEELIVVPGGVELRQFPVVIAVEGPVTDEVFREVVLNVVGEGERLLNVLVDVDP